jgi:hypothetical protein
MLAKLGSCLLLSIALLSPGPRTQAMKGKSAGNWEDRSREADRVRVSGGFYVGSQKAGGLFGGWLSGGWEERILTEFL